MEPRLRDRVLRETPLGYFADPKEIASIAVFLARTIRAMSRVRRSWPMAAGAQVDCPASQPLRQALWHMALPIRAPNTSCVDALRPPNDTGSF